MGDTAFTKEQFDTIYPEGIGNHYWNHARNNIISSFMKKHKLLKGRILEIGCGRGVVLQYLRKKDYNCFGVELGDADPFQDIRDIVFTRTDAFDLPLKFREDTDTVLLLDVIEHLKNPAEFIHEIRIRFKNAKNLLVTVPARQELWTNYDVFNGHFRRYDLTEIKKLSTAEIQLTDAGYFNHLLYPMFWIFARLIKKRKTVIKAPSGIGILVHRILSCILQLDHWLFSSRTPGTSIIALFTFGE